MRLHQGEELHAEPDLRPAIQSAEGERLDAARAEFGEEWQAKVVYQTNEAALARANEQWCARARQKLFIGGPFFGAYFAALWGAITIGPLGFVSGMAMGAICGLAAVIPLLMLVFSCEWCWQKRAENLEFEIRRLKHESRELERS